MLKERIGIQSGYTVSLSRLIFNSSSKYFFLFLIIIFSYLLPLSYSLFKQPILIDRYIIFILIPILILISLLILEINNKKLKGILLFILISSSITNNYIEIFNRKISKPEFKKILNYINKLDKNNVLVIANDDLNKKMVLNYLKNIVVIENKLIFLNKDNKDNLKNIWIVCYEPINNFNCNEKPSKFLLWNDVDSVKYNLITGILYEQNNLK